MCYNVNQKGEQIELDLSMEFNAKPKKEGVLRRWDTT